MVVAFKDNASSTREFDAEICVLKGEGTTIHRSCQAYVHIPKVRQSAFARNIEIVNHNAAGLAEENSIVLRSSSRAKIRFEFAKRPEYAHVVSRWTGPRCRDRYLDSQDDGSCIMI
jgi:elongation factor 1-alpha